MLTNNQKIKELMYENAVENYAKLNNITLEESKSAFSKMSFSEYLSLLEATVDMARQQPQQAKSAIVPPSGNPIGNQQNSSDSDDMGDNLGLPNLNAQDSGSNLQNNNQQSRQTQPQQQNNMQQQDMQKQFAATIDRLKQLAGISENASAGASCAGAMGASTAQPLGKKIQRRSVEESPVTEYTPTVAKTVVGDTKPAQASGKLSADLAARGKKTASRKNNGFKK